MSTEDKNEKVLKNCVIKRKLNFENYKNYLETPQAENERKNL